MAVDPAHFRRAAGRLPTGILVVGTSLDGVDHVMTVSAFSSVSLDPVLVLFSAEKIARFHDTVLASGTWSVSVLGEDAEQTRPLARDPGPPARRPARRHRPSSRASHRRPGAGRRSVAVLECRTTAVYDGGDHSLVLGEVVGVGRPGDVGPLIHHSGRTAASPRVTAPERCPGAAGPE